MRRISIIMLKVMCIIGSVTTLGWSAELTTIEEDLYGVKTTECFGCRDGKSYDLNIASDSTICGIITRSGSWVDAIGLFSCTKQNLDELLFPFVRSSPATSYSAAGGKGGHESFFPFRRNERIKNITVTWKKPTHEKSIVIHSLLFETNLISSGGSFFNGNPGEYSYTMIVPDRWELCGLYGTNGKYINSIGFKIRRNSTQFSSMPPLLVRDEEQTKALDSWGAARSTALKLCEETLKSENCCNVNWADYATPIIGSGAPIIAGKVVGINIKCTNLLTWHGMGRRAPITWIQIRLDYHDDRKGTHGYRWHYNVASGEHLEHRWGIYFPGEMNDPYINGVLNTLNADLNTQSIIRNLGLRNGAPWCSACVGARAGFLVDR